MPRHVVVHTVARYVQILFTVAIFGLAACTGGGLTPFSPSTSGGSLPTARPIGKGPNVLIILTDDQRLHGSLGVMPAVRRWFGHQGTRFADPFATTPLCCPARASLLAGMYAHNTHVISNNQDLATLRAVQDLTIERTLDDAGYRTAIFGKYFNGWPNDVNPAYFDEWAVTPNVTYSGAQWNVNGDSETIGTYATTFLRREATSFLAETEHNDAQPWFLYLTPMAPHTPSPPEPRFAHAAVPPFRLDPAMREHDRSDKPPFIQDLKLQPKSRIEHHRARALRSLISVDRMVGAIMRQLTAQDELANTLAIFASDNGYFWGEHGAFGKSDPYLPAVQVPLFLRWPGHVAAGGVDRRIVALLDIAPTVLDATGLRATHPMDGIDLLDPTANRTQLLLEFWRYLDYPTPSWTAIVTKRFEYAEYTDASGSITFREYYDLVRDPYELTNLLAAGAPNPPDVEALSVELTRFRTCVGQTCPR